MPAAKRFDRLDTFCAVAGALVPMGIVLGVVVFEGLVGLVGIAWILRCLLARHNPFPDLFKHPLTVPWVLWLLCVVFSTALSAAPLRGQAEDVLFFRYPLFVLALVDTSQRLPIAKYLLYGLAAGIGLALVNTLCAHLFGFDLAGKPLVRYLKKKKEAARIAGMAAFCFPFFLIWGLEKTTARKARFFILPLALFSAALLFLLRSRTPMAAALAALLFLLFWVLGRRYSYKAIAGIVAAVLIVLVIFLFFQEKYGLRTIYDRIYIWKVCTRLWLEHPLTGVGVSSFKNAFQEIVSQSGSALAFHAPDGRVLNTPVVYHAHNLVLMLLSTTGILGLISFSWLFVNAVKRIKQDLTGWRSGLAAWPIVLLVIGLTGYNIYDAWYTTLFAYFSVLIGSGVFVKKPISPIKT